MLFPVSPDAAHTFLSFFRHFLPNFSPAFSFKPRLSVPHQISYMHFPPTVCWNGTGVKSLEGTVFILICLENGVPLCLVCTWENGCNVEEKQKSVDWIRGVHTEFSLWQKTQPTVYPLWYWPRGYHSQWKSLVELLLRSWQWGTVWRCKLPTGLLRLASLEPTYSLGGKRERNSLRWVKLVKVSWRDFTPSCEIACMGGTGP